LRRAARKTSQGKRRRGRVCGVGHDRTTVTRPRGRADGLDRTARLARLRAAEQHAHTIEALPRQSQRDDALRYRTSAAGALQVAQTDLVGEAMARQ